MIPIWQAVIAAIITGGVGCAIGLALMAACAARNYHGDEQRSEPE